MLPSYLLSLREGIEAALIVGILLGAVRQIKRPELASTIWTGTIVAALLSAITAALLTVLGLEMQGAAEEIFEGFTMVIAAALLTWMIFWMSSQARAMKSNLEADIHRASQIGSRAIFFVAFFAVMREGIELALFLAASAFVSNSLQTLIGAILGLGTSILLGWSLFASTVRLDLRRFFRVTGFLLVLFAAGLFAHGVHAFAEIGWIPAIIDPVWDLTSVISKESLPGQLLGALFGYNPTPTLAEMIAYIAYYIAIGIGLARSNQKQEKQVQTAG